MRSRKGFCAAVVFLLTIPAALVIQAILGDGAETAVHFGVAIGSAFLAIAAFDFRTPIWIRIAGSIITASLAAIFLLQGMSAISQNESLGYIALNVLGQLPERLLIDALLLWFIAVLIYDSEGRSRLLGFVTVTAAVCVEIYNYWLNYNDTTLDTEFAILKITLLAPFIWILLESRKRIATKSSS